jgi:hypothetical protein
MQVSSFSNLNEMMRKAPLDAPTVSKFRNQALLAVDQAIDTFFKPEREVAEGKEAYDQLSDVERALRSYQSRFQNESKQVLANSRDQVNKLSDQSKSFRGDVGETASLLPEGKSLKNGFRQVSPGYLRAPEPPSTAYEQADIGSIVKEMSQVLPLYASVAMVPGPLSVSLKDHIKQSLQWSTRSSSQSQSNMQEEAFRLLTLSASKKTVHSASGSQSQSQGKAETTTADERVLPGLHAIRSAITKLGYAPEIKAKFKQTTSVTEWEKVEVEHGFIFKKKETELQEVNKGELEAGGETVVVPGRLALNGTAGNEGLTRPGAGADVVDLVANAKTLDQDLVDTLRERSLKVLDGATETLFNTQREVAEGRQRYDELANLQRALSIANQRFGVADGYNEKSPLAKQIAKLNTVTPLYACVAMVPGEMSSSVKNHAKELFEASSQSSSYAYSTVQADKASLFASLSETVGHSEESSSATGYVRKESTTTDERIMPILHDLRMQLDQLSITQDREGKSNLTVNVVENKQRY